MKTIRHRLLRLACSLLLVFAVASVATASHYRLPVENFISQAETEQLLKAGIRTTLGLLEEVKTAAQRKKVAQVSGLSAARVDELARQVDLLRIEGVGPGIVRLLNASGVANTKALAGEDPSALLGRMTATNMGAKITNVLPQEGQVAAWVAAAKRLPAVIDGL